MLQIFYRLWCVVSKMTVGLLGMVCSSVMFHFFLMRYVKHHLNIFVSVFTYFLFFWENFAFSQTALQLIIFKESFSIDEWKLDIKNWSSLENVEISNLKNVLFLSFSAACIACGNFVLCFPQECR